MYSLSCIDVSNLNDEVFLEIKLKSKKAQKWKFKPSNSSSISNKFNSYKFCKKLLATKM